MPTYDYVCDACTHAFEEWQSFHDPELTTCPKCKKKKLRRLIGNGAADRVQGGPGSTRPTTTAARITRKR